MNSDIRAIFEIYFSKKIDNADISEELKEELWEKIQDVIAEVQDKAYDVEHEIDNEIEDFDWNTHKANLIDDYRTQEYLERDLVEV